MKPLTDKIKITALALVLTIFCFTGHAQTIANSGKDPFNLSNIFNKNYFLKDTAQHFLSPLNFKVNPKMILACNALAYDPGYSQQVYFDNRFNSNKRYFVYDLNHYVDNPLTPYGNDKSALFWGVLNYLFYFIDK